MMIARLRKAYLPVVIAIIYQAIIFNPFLHAGEDASSYFNQGVKYFNNQEYEQALKAYSKAIEIRPDYDEAYNARGIIYYSRKEHNQAIRDFSKAIDFKPVEKYYINRASVLQETGDYDRVISDCSQVLQKNAKSAECYALRGAAYGKKGNNEKMKNDFAKANEIKPGIVKVNAPSVEDLKKQNEEIQKKLNNLDQVLGELENGLKFLLDEKPDNAIECFNRVMKNNPKNAQAYFFRGQAYEMKSEYDQAISDYTKTLELGFQDAAEVYSYRAGAYGKKGDNDRAIADYTKAIELKPKSEKNYISRGTAQAKKRNYEMAISDYNKAVEIKPKNAYAYYMRGMVYKIMKNSEQSKSDYKKAVELNPSYANKPYK